LAYEHYDYATDGLLPGCWLMSEPISDIPAKCVRINRGDGIVVWGDSHAARLAPGAREVFGTDRVSQLTRNSCPPLLGLGQPVAEIKPEANIVCNESNAGILELIRKNMPRTVILFGAWENYPFGKWKSVQSGSTTAEMLNETIQKIRAAGIADIVVLGPAPRFYPTLPSQLLQIWQTTRFDALPERLTADRSTTYAAEEVIEGVVHANGATYISLLKLFCNEGGCLTKVPGTASDLITWDDSHLTTKGAIMVARAIQNRLTIR
jgi:lysophospholipase L1-like esterase